MQSLVMPSQDDPRTVKRLGFLDTWTHGDSWLPPSKDDNPEYLDKRCKSGVAGVHPR